MCWRSQAALGKDHTCLVSKGPKGLINGDVFEISCKDVESISHRRLDMLGTDRTKIKSPEQFAKVKETVLNNKLDGLIVIGGDDSNTNAASLPSTREGRRTVQCHRDSQNYRCDLAVGNTAHFFWFDTARRSIRKWSAI